MDIREYLKSKKLICDGAFGTYFEWSKGGMMPEKANIQAPEAVIDIHSQYIRAGARLIRTNTFAANKEALGCDSHGLKECINAACDAAQRAVEQAAEDFCFVASDIGPIKGGSPQDYIEIADIFVDRGLKIIVFETFPDAESIIPAVKHIAKRDKDIFVITQFCVNQHGYTQSGISAKHIMEQCGLVDEISAVGFNCGVGPGHLSRIIRDITPPRGKYITVMPNSSYPAVMQNRLVFDGNVEYFSNVMENISSYADILGGCCGTTPKYIEAISHISADRGITIDKVNTVQAASVEKVRDNVFFSGKRKGEKIIAVELDPPKNGDCTTLMETANILKKYAVDVITFADSPSGRTRADSVLMSVKVQQEVGINVMPHICCRDKNAIGMSSLMLGAYINGIRNMLVITGDPVPSASRESIRSVFNFDSVRLMEFISQINRDNFPNDAICFGGAINYMRKNLDVEVNRALKKEQAGAKFFFTQPVYTDEDIEALRYIKSKLTAKVMVGVMPLVSYNNAMFIKNEITGINVSDDVIARFSKDMTKDEGRKTGISISAEIIKKTRDFDGYYFTIPFNRISTAKALLELVKNKQ